MAISSSWRVCVLTILPLAAAIAILLWPAGIWAQSDIQPVFTPAITQKVDARSASAKVTTDDESTLISKGYIKIGTISASQPSTKEDPEITRQLEAAVLQKSAAVGGDVVHFSKEGASEEKEVPTGKTKHQKRTCLEYGTQTVSTSSSSQSCYTDVHGFSHCTTWNTPGSRTATTCVRWSEGEEIPITRQENSLVSEGTVWRYDPQLIADIARAAEKARVAASAEDRFKSLEDKLSVRDYAGAEALLAQGVDPNAWNRDGWTHMGHEVSGGTAQGVLLLLKYGANINAKDHLEQTPLHYAASDGNSDMAELLLAHGADVNARNGVGGTPLDSAASYGNKKVAEVLLAHGAIVDARTIANTTPLHEAAYSGKLDIAELLLAHGADVNAANKWGETPMKVAKNNNRFAVVNLLSQHGGHE